MASAPTKQLKFYSPDGTDIRVTHPDGAIAIVGGEPRGLPPKFNREAIKAGCLTTDMPSANRLAGPAIKPQDDAFARRGLIKDKMIEAARSEEGATGYEDAFTQAGIPNINWLSSALGFQVERAERDELWKEAQAELDAEEEGEEGDGEPGDVE